VNHIPIVYSLLLLTSAAAIRASDDPPPACAGSESANPSVVRLVAPAYPIAANDVRVQGVVRLALQVAPSGAVASVTECRVIPFLTPACSGAAKQWRFPVVDTSETRVALLTCRFVLDDADSNNDPVVFVAPGELQIHGRASKVRPIE